jgi:hypothetical protein
MTNPFAGMRVNDARLVVQSVAAWRTFKSTARVVNAPAGRRVKLSENDTRFPLTVVVQSNSSNTSGFAPVADPSSGGNLMLSEVKGTTAGKGTAVILQPSQQLWITALVNETYRVWEIRS